MKRVSEASSQDALVAEEAADATSAAGTSEDCDDLPPGGRAAVIWRSGSARRLLSIRCSKGWRTYDWCAPFSPAEAGEDILKLRPSVESAASEGRAGSQLPLYLRLSVRMIGSRRVVCIRNALDADSKLVLPYRCLLYTSPSPRDRTRSRMPSSA